MASNMTECKKNEYLFDIDNFGQTQHYDGLIGLAIQCQRLLFIEPGSYPNNPELGVGLKSYQFEFLDDTTLNELSQKIKDQVAKYIPHKDNLEIQVKKISPNSGKLDNTIAIKFKMSYADSNKIKTNEFIITAQQVASKKSKVVSEIYV
jgi:hypothetical protein